MKREELVQALVAYADEKGVIATVAAAFGRCVRLCIPYSEDVYALDIDELDFSARANNALKRAGLFTLGAVTEAVADGRLLRIRNLGKKTENEIKTKLLAFCYACLTPTEKAQFFAELLERNACLGGHFVLQ